MKTNLASCSRLEDAANQNITCLMGLSCMTQTPKLLYQQTHKIYYGLGYKYRIYPPSGVYGNNRSQSLPGSLKMNLLQFFVKNKTQITSWMEMKSLCCLWSSHHWVTAVCLKLHWLSKPYLLLIYIFTVWHDSKCFITCKSLHQGRQKSNMLYNVSDG